MKTGVYGVLALVLSAGSALAMSDQDLQAAVEYRVKGDRSGACVAAAVIENGGVARAYVCADQSAPRPYDAHTAFEIGSISKTMTAALLADLIKRGEVSLDDPLAKLLPPGTRVPSFNGREITIANVVTHTSGLPRIPRQWEAIDVGQRFATVTERELFDVLAATDLARAPGAQWEYSNFAMMVLSDALAKRSGKDFETLLRERVLTPLGMTETFVVQRPAEVRVASGHQSNGLPANPFVTTVDMAGFGGVRATLGDMVRYVEGEIGVRESAIGPALELTQREINAVGGQAMGMNWLLFHVNGRTIAMHDGATFGASSFVAFDRASKRGVILLSDTSLVSLGGLNALGFHLIEPSAPSDAARRIAVADSATLDNLVGRYRLQNGLGMELRRKGDVLTIQADGQPEFEMGYDSAGDFYPLKFDAVLRPKLGANDRLTFTWSQLGATFAAERIGTGAPVAAKWAPTEAELAGYEGTYPLLPNFGLKVFTAKGKLFVQGTNQGPIEVVALGRDRFMAKVVAAEIVFARDAGGRVTALTLKQNGREMRGERQ